MDFILFLCRAIDSQDCLQGVRFTSIITELSYEPLFWFSIRKEYIWNLDISIYPEIFLFPSVEFNPFISYQNCWQNEPGLFSNQKTDKEVEKVFYQKIFIFS